MGITCYMVRPKAHFMYCQQWHSYLTDGNSVAPVQVTSIKVKEESVDLTALAGDRRSILVAVCFARATNSA
jgi:hypothetical protein